MLIAAGKEHWVTPREDSVNLKGKGILSTFWVAPDTNVRDSEQSTIFDSDGDKDSTKNQSSECTRKQRLIDWNTEVLYRLLEGVVGSREKSIRPLSREALRIMECKRVDQTQGTIVIDEMTQILEFPRNSAVMDDPPEMSPSVKEQLREFVSRISLLYRDVPFHNFEHCSHVIMSASK